jgi:carboxypeptidase family protein
MRRGGMERVAMVAILLCVVGACLVIAGCTGAVTGTVTSETTGEPVEGAKVVVGGLSCTTDAKGHFTLADVETGKGTVKVQCDGYTPASASVEVVRDGSMVDLVLQDGVVNGLVKEVAAEPKPVAKATVTIGDAETKTDSEGRFEFVGVPIGTHEVVVKAKDHEAYETDMDVVAGGNEATFKLSLTPTATYMRYYDAYRFGHYGRAWRYVHKDVKKRQEYSRYVKNLESSSVVSFKIEGERMLKKWKAPGIGKTYKNVAEIDRIIRWQGAYGTFTDNYSQHWVKVDGKWFIVFDPTG